MEGQQVAQNTLPSQQVATEQVTAVTPTHTTKWLVVLLLILFPPAAIYVMGKDKRYHSWFPILLWIYAGVTLSVSLLQLFVLMPKLSTLYQELNAPKRPTLLAQNLLVVLIISALAQIVFGFFLRQKVKTIGELPKTLLWIAIIILVIDYLFLPTAQGIALFSMILPLYNLTSGL